MGQRSAWTNALVMALAVAGGGCASGAAQQLPRATSPSEAGCFAEVPSFTARPPDGRPRLEGRDSPFSSHAWGIAEALGLSAQLQLASSAATHERRREARRQVIDRIALAKFRISAMRAGFDCAGDRVELAKEELRSRADRHTTLLTVGSILIDAVAGITAAALELGGGQSRAATVVALTGGSLGAATGLWALLPPSSRVDYRHRRNVLADVWTGRPSQGLFTADVWHLLHLSDASGVSPRQRLIQRWRAQLASSPESEQLLFGAGGAYSVEELSLREAFFELVESESDLLNQTLESLLEEVIAAPSEDAALTPAPPRTLGGTSAG